MGTIVSNGGSSRSITAKQVVVGVLILLVIVLAIANRNKVKVDFIVHDFTMPLFLVIVGSALVGWLIGWFMGRNRDD
jgi:uncharacterized integral membrane protein